LHLVIICFYAMGKTCENKLKKLKNMTISKQKNNLKIWLGANLVHHLSGLKCHELLWVLFLYMLI